MNIHQISPYVRRAMESVLSPGCRIGQRVLFDYELIYLESGSVKLTYDHSEYLCHAGDFIFLRPGVPHSLEIPEGYVSQPHIHFDLCYSQSESEKRYVSYKDLDEFTPEELELIHPDMIETPQKPVFSEDTQKLRPLLYSVIQNSKRTDLDSAFRVKADMTRIIGILLEQCGETAGPAVSSDIAMLVKHYIDHNIRNRITLEHLEMHFHYNRFYLEKKFTAAYGIPIARYCDTLRLEAVKEYLQQRHTVTETAEYFHFQSIYSFSRWFRNACGLPPKTYRTNALSSGIIK